MNSESSAVWWPALQIGAVSGTCGLIVGGTTGLIRSTSPGLFAAASGLQWFALGSTFWGIRGLLLAPRGSGSTTPSDRVRASTIAGGISGGSVASLIRGRSNIVPGVIMFSIFGCLGQCVYNTLDAQHTEEVIKAQTSKSENLLQRIAKSRFSPMKVLSDKEYEDMLQEKLLRIDAEIAIIDENIQRLRDQANDK